MIAEASFEQAFAALTESTPDPQSQRSGGHQAAPMGRVPRALDHYHRGDLRGCALLLNRMSAAERAAPTAQALHAACRAVLRGRLHPAICTCLELLEQSADGANVYYVLGSLFLRMYDNAAAHAAFRAGLEIDPEHAALRERLALLGQRRPPLLPFLGRAHPLNRTLGWLRARLARPPEVWDLACP